jgi:serine/threonine-protein kinase
VLCGQCGKQAPNGAKFCVHCGAHMTDPAADTLVVEESESDVLLRSVRKELAADYNIERELGRGGMAIVYEAVDIQLGRRVALKVLPPELALRRSMADRFKREAKMAAALDHPNIVPVYRVGQSGGLLYIAMKFIRGRALDDILEAQGPLPIPVVLHVLRGAAGALAYAHERGIVHRDVKSANIMIDLEGRAVVSDFGIARAVEEPQLTATGTVVGTPYFMSPEQCAARRIGPQSDQYSLGVVAFQMLTGSVPFSADTLPGIMHHHFYTTVPDVRTARTEIPVELHGIVQRLLAKKSEDRYASTQALADAIRAIPLAAPDRREAERILRDLAGGAPMPRVAVSTLPPLQTSVRLTPAAAPTVAQRIRHRLSRPVVVGASGTAFILVAATGWVVSRPDTGPLEVAAGSAATIMAPESTQVTQPAAGRSPAESPPRAPRAPTPTPPDERGTVAPPGGGVTRAVTRRVDDRLPVTVPASDAAAPTNGADSTIVPRRERPPVAVQRVPAGAAGRLRLRADPSNAAIYVDDVLLNHGVVFDAPLAAGQRRLRIEAAGYETYEATIEIVAGETLQMQKVGLTPRRSRE